MAKETIISCNICGCEKKEVNHWWILEYNLFLKSTLSYPFENRYADILDTNFEKCLCLCGLEHLLIAENRIRQGLDPIPMVKPK